MKQITIRLSNEMDAAWHDEAERRETSLAAVAREAIAAHLVRLELEDHPRPESGQAGR